MTQPSAVLALALLWAGLAVAGTPSPSPSAAAQRPFSDPFLGFKCLLPTDYTAQPESGSPAIFLGPSQPPFRSNVNIFVEMSAIPLEDYVAKTIQSTKSPGAKIGAPERFPEVDKNPAVLLRVEGSHKGHPTQSLLVIVNTKKAKYLLTGTTLRERVPAFESVFRTLLASVKFSERTPLDDRPGRVFADTTGLFTWALPLRFPGVRHEGTGAHFTFPGPIELAAPVSGDVDVVALPAAYAPENIKHTVEELQKPLKSSPKGEHPDEAKFVYQPGLVLGVMVKNTVAVEGGTITEYCRRQPIGKWLVIASLRAPTVVAPLYEKAFRASLMALKPVHPLPRPRPGAMAPSDTPSPKPLTNPSGRH